MNDSPPRFPVVVVADSAASIPAESLADPRLLIVPMRLALDGQQYTDGVDMNASEFYRLQKSSSAVASTAAPSPEAFLDVFREASRIARAIICLTVSSRYSSSTNAANSALKEMGGFPIMVLDSRTAGGGEGLVVLEALRAAESGLPFDEVVKRTCAVIEKVRLVAMLDTLHYLWKGGRVPRLAMAGASLLNIKPVFELRLGEAGNVARPRTRRRAMGRLLDYVTKNAGSGPIHACVMHSDCLDDAMELETALASTFECKELYISELTPVLGAHIGPGMAGIAFWSE